MKHATTGEERPRGAVVLWIHARSLCAGDGSDVTPGSVLAITHMARQDPTPAIPGQQPRRIWKVDSRQRGAGSEIDETSERRPSLCMGKRRRAHLAESAHSASKRSSSAALLKLVITESGLEPGECHRWRVRADRPWVLVAVLMQRRRSRVPLWRRRHDRREFPANRVSCRRRRFGRTKEAVVAQPETDLGVVALEVLERCQCTSMRALS